MEVPGNIPNGFKEGFRRTAYQFKAAVKGVEAGTSGIEAAADIIYFIPKFVAFSVDVVIEYDGGNVAELLRTADAFRSEGKSVLLSKGAAKSGKKYLFRNGELIGK